MNSHTGLQQNVLELLMKDNDRIDKDMNETLQNGDVGSIIGLLNSHTLPQDNESSKLNEINIIFDNGYVTGDYCYMNSYTGSESKNQNYIDYANKIYEISTNRYLNENYGLPDSVDIDDMLPSSALNQFINMEYNNEDNKFQINGNISTPNKSSVSTLTSPSVTSTND